MEDIKGEGGRFWRWGGMAEKAATPSVVIRPIIFLFLLASPISLLGLLRFILFPSYLLSTHPRPPPHPQQLLLTPASPPNACNGSWVYVYNLPSQFNSDLLKNCSSINPWASICPALSNAGMGVALTDFPSPHQYHPPQPSSWYATDQFTTEIIFHNRLQQHPCTTDNPDLATLFFVPFYAGLAVYRHLFFSKSVLERDMLCSQLLEWLSEHHYWRRNGGWDHFFVIGRITWDFRRADDTGWGSSFLHMPAMENTTRLLIERNPWDDREIAIPYPTSFHPRTDEEIQQWQDDVRSSRRTYLFSYAGAPRKQLDFRGILLKQCEESESCKALDCSNGKCEHAKPVIQLFLQSNFCMQPTGDSFTRRSIFDALIAGCIPVFFWNESAYWQYEWHLPSDPSSYSVFIPNDEIKSGRSIEKVLMDVPAERVGEMRSAVVSLIPSLLYANPDNHLSKYTDAFDVSLRGMISRVASRTTHRKHQLQVSV